MTTTDARKRAAHRPPCVDGDRCGEAAHCPPDALTPTEREADRNAELGRAQIRLREALADLERLGEPYTPDRLTTVPEGGFREGDVAWVPYRRRSEAWHAPDGVPGFYDHEIFGWLVNGAAYLEPRPPDPTLAERWEAWISSALDGGYETAAEALADRGVEVPR